MLPGRAAESVNLRIKKEGLRRAFPGTGYSFEAGDKGWVRKFKYYLIGSREMINVQAHKSV